MLILSHTLTFNDHINFKFEEICTVYQNNRLKINHNLNYC